MMKTMKVELPWTAAQIDALNHFQRRDDVHEFTCGNDHDGDRTLVATRNGWICPHCDWVQTWAWEMMMGEFPLLETIIHTKKVNVLELGGGSLFVHRFASVEHFKEWCADKGHTVAEKKDGTLEVAGLMGPKMQSEAQTFYTPDAWEMIEGD